MFSLLEMLAYIVIAGIVIEMIAVLYTINRFRM